MDLFFIICKSRQRKALLDEIADWKDEGANVVLTGITHKTHHGFIFLEWCKPAPERFVEKLREDPDIIDYVPIGHTSTVQP